jgi:hypothetical protein
MPVYLAVRLPPFSPPYGRSIISPRPSRGFSRGFVERERKTLRHLSVTIPAPFTSRVLEQDKDCMAPPPMISCYAIVYKRIFGFLVRGSRRCGALRMHRLQACGNKHADQCGDMPGRPRIDTAPSGPAVCPHPRPDLKTTQLCPIMLSAGWRSGHSATNIDVVVRLPPAGTLQQSGRPTPVNSFICLNLRLSCVTSEGIIDASAVERRIKTFMRKMRRHEKKLVYLSTSDGTAAEWRNSLQILLRES